MHIKYPNHASFFLLLLIALTFISMDLSFPLLRKANRNSQFYAQNSAFMDNAFQTASEITPTEGNIGGQGLPLNVTLFCNKSSDYALYNLQSAVMISVPSPWAVTYTNISIDQILLNPIIIEDAISSRYQDTQTNPYAMQFNLSYSTVLDNFSIYLYDVHKVTNLKVMIYNATLQDSHPAPHLELFSQDFSVNNALDYAWHTFKFSSSPELNPVATYANAFFLVLFPTVDPGGKFQWGYELDSVGVDSGAAYRYSSPNWILESWDFNLKIVYANRSRTPSSIDLRINGTAVSDINENEGNWISADTYADPSGYIYFTFSANESVTFFLKWFVSYQLAAPHEVQTYFTGSDTDTVIFWNASYEATYLSGTFDKKMVFQIPAWENVMRLWKNQTIHHSWSVYSGTSSNTVTISAAENAIWTIECNDTNYVSQVFVKRSGAIVTEVNSTDTLDIFTNFSRNLMTGDANLTIFPIHANYNDTFGESITNNKTIQFHPAWIPSQTASASYPSAKLQVIWFNGTAAGINAATIIIHYVPTNLTLISLTEFVESGDSIFAQVTYRNAYTAQGIPHAKLLVKNSTDNTEWSAPYSIITDYLNGTYRLEILSLGIPPGIHYLSMNFSKPLFLSSQLSDIPLTLAGGISNLSVVHPECYGLDPLNNSYAITTPSPYHNSSVTVQIYYFSDLTLEPLSNAIISGTWIGGGPEISWTPSFFGYYSITIDVSGFHSDTTHTLRITVQQAGYDSATLYIIVPISKLPTRITPLEPSYESYLQDPLLIQAIFEDTHNSESIATVYELNGNFTIQIQDFHANMTLLTPLIGIYQYILDLNVLGLQEGSNYSIILSAYSSEHQFANLSLSLYIIPKNPVNLTLLMNLPYLLAGTSFKIYAQLTNQTGSPFINTPLNCFFVFQPGGLQISHTFLTNSSGVAEISGDVNPQMQSLQIIIKYDGTSKYQNATVYSQNISIIILDSNIIISPLPKEIQAGEILEISVLLLINGSPSAGKIIEFTFTYQGSQRLDYKSAGTNSEGIASVSFKVPSDVTRVYVTASYSGMVYVNASTSQSSLAVITIWTLIGRSSPYWGIALVLAVGAVLYYDLLYRRPRKQQKRVRREKIKRKFDDLHQITYLLFIHKIKGLPLYEKVFKAEDINPVLISGFFQAISSFQDEILKSKMNTQTKGWKLDYQNFKVSLFNGALSYLAVISDKDLSEDTRTTIYDLLSQFEAKYENTLQQFKGIVSIFEETAEMIRSHLETDLILPQKVITPEISSMHTLSKKETAILALALTLEEATGHFFLSKLLITAVAARGETELEILEIIYDLWTRKFFVVASE